MHDARQDADAAKVSSEGFTLPERFCSRTDISESPLYASTVVVYVKSDAPLCHLQDELGEAGTKLQALQSEMQKLRNNAEELWRKLKAARSDMQQAQKDCQVGLVKLCF